MTSSSDLDGVLEPQPAPAHGPQFWTRLDQTLAEVGSSQVSQRDREPAPTQLLDPVVAVRQDRTAELPQAIVTAQVGSEPDGVGGERGRLVPMAVAAALLALVAIGFVGLGARSDPGPTTEVAAGPTAAPQAVPVDGPELEGEAASESGASGEAASESGASGEAASESGASGEAASESGASGQIASESGASGQIASGESEANGVDGRSESRAEDGSRGDAPGSGVDDMETDQAVAAFAPAPGAPDEAEHLPLDGGIPEGSTFLRNSFVHGLTWYGVTDDEGSCRDARYARIRFVNRSGITQDFHEPQVWLSGELSHLAASASADQVAWLVSCGDQLELHVSTIDSTGTAIDPELVWFGRGAVAGATVRWDGDVVTLSSAEQGRPFIIDYDTTTRIPSRNGGPTRIMLETGVPPERSRVPEAADASTGHTYWAGRAPAGTSSGCPQPYGSGIADTLWLRSGEGDWQLAVAGEFALGAVTAVALEPESSQVALADRCAGAAGRLLLGTVRADGQVIELDEIDLTPFVPGFVDKLFWADATTLRIETDNSEYGFGVVRFDLRLDHDGADSIMVQLD